MLALLTVLAAAFPVGVCYAARWWLGRDRLQPIWIFPALVVAGGLGGLVFGLWLSPNLEPWFLAIGWDVEGPLFRDAIVVPLAEEIGKTLVLLAFLPTRWFRSAVDGLVYGFAAGCGFAVVEDLLYFLSALTREGEEGFFAAIAVRLPSALLVHGGATAVVGVYLGAARWERRALVVFAALPAALFVATAIHGGWNALVVSGSAVGALAVLPGIGLVLVALGWASARLEAREVRLELANELLRGTVTEDDVRAALDMRRRRRDHGAMAVRVLALAFALRRMRTEGRSGTELERLREALRARRT